MIVASRKLRWMMYRDRSSRDIKYDMLQGAASRNGLWIPGNNFHHSLLNHRTDTTIEGVWTMLKEITLKQAFLLSTANTLFLNKTYWNNILLQRINFHGCNGR
jgi:hypothetical protein